MRYSGAVGGSLDAERDREIGHRRLVEDRSADLPSLDGDGSNHRVRELRRVMVPAARRARGAMTRVSRSARRVTQLARAAAGRRRRTADRQVLEQQLGRLPPVGPSPDAVTCVVFGEPDGPAARAARGSGWPVEVVSRAAEIPRPGPGQTSRELLCFMAAQTEPLTDGFFARLAAAIEGDVVAAAPVLVHPQRPLLRATPHDGLVRSSGLEVTIDADGAPVLRARAVGTVARPDEMIDHVPAVTGACILVDRDAYERAGGWSPDVDVPDVDVAAIDLCLRLRADGGRVAVVHNAIAIDHRRPVDAHRPDMAVDTYGPSWLSVIERRGPSLWRQATRRPRDDEHLHIALTIAAPSEKMAPRWGDWHLAGALARSLERLGHVVRVQTIDHADDPAGRACDIHVVLRGLHAVHRTSGQRHVLWVISHPERVDISECDEADLVLVASERFAHHLASRTTTPVEVMLQATDHHRFHRVMADPRHAHPIAVVAKSRDVPRPIVLDAITAGLRPAIYGTGWERFVDPDLIVAGYVPNDEIPTVYSSIGLLLNDHWQEMREWGFVSNRLFDVLACATPVISDDLPEIGELFDDAVPTYREPADLRATADEVLGEPAAAAARAQRGRALVLAAHTFDRRGADIVALLHQYGLVGGDS